MAVCVIVPPLATVTVPMTSGSSVFCSRVAPLNIVSAPAGAAIVVEILRVGEKEPPESPRVREANLSLD